VKFCVSSHVVLLGGLLLQVDDLLSIQSVNAICLPENYRLNVCTVQPFLCFSSVVPWQQFSYFPGLNRSRENSFLSSACIKKKNPIHDTLCGVVGRVGGVLLGFSFTWIMYYHGHSFCMSRKIMTRRSWDMCLAVCELAAWTHMHYYPAASWIEDLSNWGICWSLGHNMSCRFSL
jgi:hypothetical protein